LIKWLQFKKLLLVELNKYTILKSVFKNGKNFLVTVIDIIYLK